MTWLTSLKGRFAQTAFYTAFETGCQSVCGMFVYCQFNGPAVEYHALLNEQWMALSSSLKTLTLEISIHITHASEKAALPAAYAQEPASPAVIESDSALPSSLMAFTLHC